MSDVCSNPNWDNVQPFALTRGSFQAGSTGFQAQCDTFTHTGPNGTVERMNGGVTPSGHDMHGRLA